MSETREDLDALARALEDGAVENVDPDAVPVGKVYYWICSNGYRFACEADGFHEDNQPINQRQA